MIASPKSFPKPTKEDDEGGQAEESNKTIEPSQAPSAFEEGGNVT